MKRKEKEENLELDQGRKEAKNLKRGGGGGGGRGEEEDNRTLA